MKLQKRLFAISFTGFFLAAALSACTQNPEDLVNKAADIQEMVPEASEQTDKEELEDKSTAEEKDTEEQADQDTEAAIDASEWKEAYINKLRELAQDENVPNLSVLLVDMDNDGVAEMIVDTMPGGDYSGIYTYKDGSVECLLEEICFNFCKIGDLYTYTNVRLAADDPLAIHGITKLGSDIADSVDASFFVSGETGGVSALVSEGDNLLADNYEDGVAAMETFGIHVSVTHDSEYNMDYFDYSADDMTNYDWIYCDGYDDSIDLSEIENYIQAY